MIDLYTWTTPNGRKASILLEELGLPYTAHAVDISKDEQFKPEFLKVSPNNRIPAIVDRDTGISLMESAALMIYLADKTGKLLPKDGEPRYRALEWLMWQMGGPGPMFGQVHHFVKYNKGKAPYAEERYSKEAHRLYGVIDRRLADREFVADNYSIADISIWPWVSRYEWQTVDLNTFPNVKRWSGHTLEQILEDSDRDHWFTAQEALEYGLIDHVYSNASQLSGDAPNQ